MGKSPTAADAMLEVADAVHELRHLLEPPREIRGYRSELARFPALLLACRFCVDVETGEGLAARFKRVPDEFLEPAEKRTRCLCGEFVPWGDLTPCSCGRWFAADESGAWAARFEETN